MLAPPKSGVKNLTNAPTAENLVQRSFVAAGPNDLWSPNGIMRTSRPRKDSNLRTRFRKPMLFPLSYGGVTHTSSEWAATARHNPC